MSAHTPGPWLRDYGQNYAEIVCALSPRGKVKTIARIASGVKSREADARLIAAAPTMYDYIKAQAGLGDTEAAKILESIDGHS